MAEKEKFRKVRGMIIPGEMRCRNLFDELDLVQIKMAGKYTAAALSVREARRLRNWLIKAIPEDEP